MKCCICKHKIEPDLNGWKGGHNPFPVRDKGSCCGECNYELVVPARLTQMLGIKVKEARKISKEVENVNAYKV